MMDVIPSEVPIGGIYVSPVLIAALVGLVAAWLVAKVLNRTRLTRFFWRPPLVFLAIWAIMTVLAGVWFEWS